MNIQDIANFIDLVNNPEKYNRVLKNLQDEQARLTAVLVSTSSYRRSRLESL